jgi:hypothetical protein
MEKMRLYAMYFVLLVAFSAVGSFAVHAATQDALPALQISLLNQDPSPANAGSTVTLRFKVENSGGKQIDSVDVQLVEDYPFTVADSQPIKTVNNIGAYQAANNYATLEYTVKIDKDAPQGTHDLRLKYRVDNGDWITATGYTVDVANKQYAQIIYVDKARISPGKETQINFTIVNVGNAPLQNMVFSWQEPTGTILPVYSSDTKYVKYLDAGQSVVLSYTVMADVNANPGLYQLNLDLESESTTGTATSIVSTKAGVFVGGETDFDVAFSQSSQGQTSLSVSNIGNNPALSVSVVVPQQQGFRVEGTNSAIIGNLDKGDYTTVSFQIASTAASSFNGTGGQRQRTANESLRAGQTGSSQTSAFARNFNGSNLNASREAMGGNNLLVDIYYTDTTGERQVVEKSVPIQFSSSSSVAGGTTASFSGRTQQASSKTTLYWIIGIVVVIAAVVLFNRKYREKVFMLFGGTRQK